MYIPPLPKNMHPVHNQERRQARAKALHKIFEKSEDAVYVDAADYIYSDAMALAVVHRHGDSIASGLVRTTQTEVGEEAAIALAMTASPKIKFIVKDSKSAILNFSRGRISPEASQIITSRSHDERNGKIYLIWERPTRAWPETSVRTMRLEALPTELASTLLTQTLTRFAGRAETGMCHTGSSLLIIDLNEPATPPSFIPQ